MYAGLTTQEEQGITRIGHFGLLVPFGHLLSSCVVFFGQASVYSFKLLVFMEVVGTCGVLVLSHFE